MLKSSRNRSDNRREAEDRVAHREPLSSVRLRVPGTGQEAVRGNETDGKPSSRRSLGRRLGRAAPHIVALLMAVILVACRTGGKIPGAIDTAKAPQDPTTPATRPATVPAPSPTPSMTAIGTPSTKAKGEDTPTPSPSAPSDKRALRPLVRSGQASLPNATRYQVDLSLNLEQATLSGHQQISYTNTETVPLDALYLRLFPNTAGYGGQMSVSRLSVDGERVEPQRELDGSALRLPLSPPLAPHQPVELSLDFSLTLPSEDRPSVNEEASDGYRQLGRYQGVVALANAYPIIPVYDDEGWNVELAPSYGDAVFSDAAFFDVSITAPQTMTLAASGTCIQASDDVTATTWSCTAPLMRDFNALLREDYRVESQDVDGIAVNSVFYAGHEEGGAAALDYASQSVRIFDARLGRYPFTELDVVESPTLAGGIEYPGLVVINETYYATPQGVSDRMEWVVVHEVLHQWWYSLVGNDQVDEPWLDEALVQYCTLLYYEERYGRDVADRLVQSVFQEPYQELRETGRDQPVGLPVEAYSRRNYGPVVYQKGPLYFHNLREQVGSEAFWDILATYFERNCYGIARPEDWLAAVEAVTGSEYRPLYDTWIQETGG